MCFFHFFFSLTKNYFCLPKTLNKLANTLLYDSEVVSSLSPEKKFSLMIELSGVHWLR